MSDSAQTGRTVALSADESGALVAACTLIDTLPVPGLLLDRRGRIAAVSTAVVHRFGYAKAELLGEPASIVVVHGLPKIVPPGGATAVVTILHKDGTQASVTAIFAAIPTRLGLTTCVLSDGATVDTAAQTGTRQRLAEAQRIAKIGSWTWDVATDEHWWSEELYRMLQIDRDEPRPIDRFLALLRPADRERMQEGSAMALRGGNAPSFDARVSLADGSERIFHIEGGSTRDEHGALRHMHGTVQDVTEQRETQLALQLTERRYREAQRLAKIGNWEWNLATNTSWWSDELYRILEEDRATYASTFDNFLAKIHPDDRQTLVDGQRSVDLAQTLPGEPIYAPTVSRVVLADGRQKIVEQLVEARLDAYGKPEAIVGSIHDITERRALEDRLRESEARYASTVELAAVGIIHVGLDGRIEWSNQRFRDMLGYAAEELSRLTVWDISHPEDVHVTDTDRALLHAGKIDSIKVEKRYVRKNGGTVWVHITSALRRSAEGAPLYDVSVVEDITQRKSAEDRVQYLATHDELTGLPNRALFAELLDREIANTAGTRKLCALLFIDLDRFKIVNDSLGHEAGDTLLKEVARRLVRSVGSAGVVARLGGDEFVVLLGNLTDTSQATDLAKRVLSGVLAPVTIRGHECRVTVSIGIAAYPLHAADATTLMKHADVAMYLAKEEGKNNCKLYSPDATPMSVERLALEAHLSRALDRRELALHYQPKVDVATGRIKGAEALLRWWNKELGTVSPGQFIPVAEDTGLIVPIGKWVLRTACEQNVAWQRRGLPPIVMSVNLSPRQFKDSTLLDDIAEVLRDTGMRPELLELEITESMIMHNVERAAEKAAAIKNLGVRLAIDDFGTGYSSLSQLKRFPIDTLKVDRSFIRDIPDSDDDRAITEAIISLGQALGVSIIAEGVETEAQHHFLREHACDEMQGFLVSKPCHPDAFVDLLKAEPPPRRG